jgi:hypothetical protein
MVRERRASRCIRRALGRRRGLELAKPDCVSPPTNQISAFDAFSLAAPLWLIETRQGGPFAEVTYLQAEAWGSHFLLAFTSEEKAAAAIETLGVAERARPTRVTEGDARMEMVTVVCQVGAHGIIVDLDPSTRQCAWSRRLLAAA